MSHRPANSADAYCETKSQLAASEEGAHLSQSPPSVFNRRDRKKKLNAERSKVYDGEMGGFHSSQRRYVRDQIAESELCPYSKAESLIHQAEAFIILDVVLNDH
jgi:hypothetical protein